MSDTEDNILKVLKTRNNANDFIRFLESVYDSTHRLDKMDIQKVVSERFGDSNVPDWAEYVVRVFKSFDNFPDQKNTRDKIGDLKKIIKNSKVITVEISFEPSATFVSELYELLSKSDFLNLNNINLTNGFLIDFNIVKISTGGIKMYIEGKYIDLTYKSFISNYLMSKDVIKRYL